MAGREHPIASTASADFYLISSWYAEPEFIGATMLFRQTSAPLGWTKNTTVNNHAIRIVSGTTGGTVSAGGSPFSTIYSSRAATGTVSSVTISAGAFTISQSYIPSHSHSTSSSPGGSAFGLAPGPAVSPVAGVGVVKTTVSTYGQPALAGGPGGSDGSHSHSGGVVSGGPVSGTINMAIKYVDVIIATKD